MRVERERMWRVRISRGLTAGVMLACLAHVPRAGAQVESRILKQNVRFFDAAAADRGSVGALFSHPPDAYNTGPLRYLGLDPYGGVEADEEMKVDGGPYERTVNAALVYDRQDVLHVFAYRSLGLDYLKRSGTAWASSRLVAAPNHSGWRARRDREGAFHLLGATFYSREGTLLYLHNRGGTWQQQSVPINAGEKRPLHGADLVPGDNGVVHIVYSVQYQPSKEEYWSAELYYLTNASGTWSQETIALVSETNLDAALIVPRVTLAPDGSPAVAAHLKYNVYTGSDALSQLFYARRAGSGNWPSTLVADVADGYFGTDGGRFTGLRPDLAIDASDRVHIIFSDLASSHVEGHEEASVGQIRYAVLAGGVWTLATLFRQSAAANEGISASRLLLKPDGSGFDILARTIRGKEYPFNADTGLLHVYTAKPPAPTPTPTPTPAPMVGQLAFDHDLYGGEADRATLRLVDADPADDPGRQDTRTVEVYSDAGDPTGFAVVLTESGTSTGLFTSPGSNGTLGFSLAASNAPLATLRVASPDTIRARYRDPSPSTVAQAEARWQLAAVPFGRGGLTLGLLGLAGLLRRRRARRGG